MTEAQAWALVIAVLAAGTGGHLGAVGAVLALLFLLADGRERSNAGRDGGKR